MPAVANRTKSRSSTDSAVITHPRHVDALLPPTHQGIGPPLAASNAIGVPDERWLAYAVRCRERAELPDGLVRGSAAALPRAAVLSVAHLVEPSGSGASEGGQGVQHSGSGTRLHRPALDRAGIAGGRGQDESFRERHQIGSDAREEAMEASGEIRGQRQ